MVYILAVIFTTFLTVLGALVIAGYRQDRQDRQLLDINLRRDPEKSRRTTLSLFKDLDQQR